MKKLLYISLIALMPFWTSTGAVLPGTGSNVDRAGNSDWTSPENILTDNNTTASCTGVAGSDYLVASNFNFSSIPNNAIIVGITVRWALAESSTGSETTSSQLQDASAALFGSVKTTSVNGTGETNYDYGSTSDLWGLNNTTISAAIIKDADFGARLWYATAHNMTCDFVQITIEYAAGGGFFRSISSARTFRTQNKKTI